MGGVAAGADHTRGRGGGQRARLWGVAPDLGESVPALLVLGSPARTSASKRKIEDEDEIEDEHEHEHEDEDEDEDEDEHGRPRGGGAQHSGPDSPAVFCVDTGSGGSVEYG